MGTNYTCENLCWIIMGETWATPRLDPSRISSHTAGSRGLKQRKQLRVTWSERKKKAESHVVWKTEKSWESRSLKERKTTESQVVWNKENSWYVVTWSETRKSESHMVANTENSGESRGPKQRKPDDSHVVVNKEKTARITWSATEKTLKTAKSHVVWNEKKQQRVTWSERKNKVESHVV